MAMERLYGRFRLRGKPLKIQWGKAPAMASSSAGKGKVLLPPPPPPLSSIVAGSSETTGSVPIALPVTFAPEDLSLDDLDRLAMLPPPPGQDDPMLYPSMDPKMLGTATKTYRA